MNCASNNVVISIVVPVYNVARYLPSCLDSLLHAQGNNAEVIAVNDCSTDDSGQILADYASRYPTLHVETLPFNQGVSAARNRGLDVAIGKYVFFVDSDDRIASEAIPKLLGIISQHTPDIIFFQYRRVDENGKTLQDATPVVEHLFDLKDSSVRRLTFDTVLGNLLAWNALYRREALGDLRFHAFQAGEDVLFGAQAYCRAQSLFQSSLVLYDYVQRQGSATCLRTKRHCTSTIDAACLIVSSIKATDFYGLVKDMLFRKIRCMSHGLTLTVLLAVPQPDRRACWEHWFDCLSPVFLDPDLVPLRQRRIYRFAFYTRSRLAVLLLLRLPIQIKGWLLSFPMLKHRWIQVRQHL